MAAAIANSQPISGDIERYLKSATIGLWGPFRKQVRDEILAHIEERAWKHEVGGLSLDDARLLAIEELGPPVSIAAGMTGVYLMPTILRKVAISILVGSVGLAIFSGGKILVEHKTLFAECENQTSDTAKNINGDNVPCSSDVPTVDFYQLKEILEPQGAKFETEVVDGKEVPFMVTFPEGPSIVWEFGKWDRGYQTQSGTTESATYQGTNSRDVPVIMLLDKLTETGLPLEVKNWKSPEVQIGTSTFELDGLSDQYKQILFEGIASRSYDFYKYAADKWLTRWEVMSENLMIGKYKTPISTSFKGYAIKVSGDSQNVYVAVAKYLTTIPPYMKADMLAIGKGLPEMSFDERHLEEIRPNINFEALVPSEEGLSVLSGLPYHWVKNFDKTEATYQLDDPDLKAVDAVLYKLGKNYTLEPVDPADISRLN